MSVASSTARPTNRGTAIEMAVSGIIGLCASFVLSIEAWQLAADQGRTFSCDVSSVLSCSAVAATPQARVLGFPNAFLGIFFEAVVLTVSFALIAGVRFPKWYYLGVEALYTIGLLFAYWLFTQSYFVIHVLCPWCLLITITTTLVWFGLTRVCISQGVLPAPAWWKSVMKAGGDWLVVVLVIAAVLAMIVVRYGSVLFAN